MDSDRYLFNYMIKKNENQIKINQILKDKIDKKLKKIKQKFNVEKKNWKTRLG